MYSQEKVSQWHIVRSDKWLLSSLTWIPVLLAVSIWWIFSQGIARDLPIGIVNLEQSKLSRTFVRELNATSSLNVSHSFSNVSEAKNHLISNDIYAYVVIPNNFDRDLYLNLAPQISVFYNSQYILIGKLIKSAVLQAHGTFNAQVGSVKQLAKGNTTTQTAAGKTVIIRNQITPLFNRNANYAQFLITAIIPALWQISIVVTTILALTANHRIYGLENMIGTRPVRSLISIGLFYLPWFIFLGYCFLVWFYQGLGFPIEGGLLPLIYAQVLTAIACMIMAAFFFFLTLDPARAMSFAGAFTAPSFAFMGVTFPVTDMNSIAAFWRNLMPVSHYIEAQIGTVSYNVTSWETIRHITPSMMWYLLPFILCLFLIKKHLTKMAVSA